MRKLRRNDYVRRRGIRVPPMFPAPELLNLNSEMAPPTPLLLASIVLGLAGSFEEMGLAVRALDDSGLSPQRAVAKAIMSEASVGGRIVPMALLERRPPLGQRYFWSRSTVSESAPMVNCSDAIALK